MIDNLFHPTSPHIPLDEYKDPPSPLPLDEYKDLPTPSSR